MEVLAALLALAVATFGARVVWPWALDRWFAGHGPVSTEPVDGDRAAGSNPGPVDTGRGPPDRLRVRGLMRWLVLGFFGLLGAGLLVWAAAEAVNRDENMGVLLAGLLAAAGLALVGFAGRGWMRGIDADVEGVVVTNMFRTHRLQWSELVDISFDEVMNQGGGTAYHRLRLETGRRRRIVVEVPGGSAKSGSRIDRVRTDLLAMRDQALSKPS